MKIQGEFYKPIRTNYSIQLRNESQLDEILFL